MLIFTVFLLVMLLLFMYTINFLSFFFDMSLILYLYFFFFSSRRRHTRLTCDWSSDVCSSDLHRQAAAAAAPGRGQPAARHRRGGDRGRAEGRDPVHGGTGRRDHRGAVLRLQRHGGRGAGRQGEGEGVGQPVRAADGGGAGLPAAQGPLAAT